MSDDLIKKIIALLEVKSEYKYDVSLLKYELNGRQSKSKKTKYFKLKNLALLNIVK